MENWIRNKGKKTGLLCGINPLVWQWIFDNFPKDEVETRSSRNLILQNGTENSMDWASNQWGNLKENDIRKNTYTYTQNQEKMSEIK